MNLMNLMMIFVMLHMKSNYHKKVNDSINRSMIIEEDKSSLYNQVMDDIGQPY